MPDTSANSPEYYRRREEQERDLARSSVSPDIRNIHLEMAHRYAALATGDSTQRHRGLVAG